MNNLEIYDKVRTVPETAKKKIEGGKLKGKTDINPMWRIKVLTEVFGPCGIGWKYIIKDKKLEHGAKGEIAAFVDIDLFYVTEKGVWSEPIPGTGGAMFVATEKQQLVTNDECFKMALTDAISVAGKAIGIAADVYYEKDRTKYDGYGTSDEQPDKKGKSEQLLCIQCGTPFKDVVLEDGKKVTAEKQYANAIQVRGGPYCKSCHEMRKAAAK